MYIYYYDLFKHPAGALQELPPPGDSERDNMFCPEPNLRKAFEPFEQTLTAAGPPRVNVCWVQTVVRQVTFALPFGKGPMGSALMGSLQISSPMFSWCLDLFIRWL